MDIQAMLNAVLAGHRRDRSKYHLTLGSLIAKLEALPSGTKIMFDNGSFPGEPHSYRGYYDELSFAPHGVPLLASEFLTIAKQALGNTYEGYKGGDYVMGEDAPLWAAPYGCTGVAIIDLTKDGVLVTKDVD